MAVAVAERDRESWAELERRLRRPRLLCVTGWSPTLARALEASYCVYTLQDSIIDYYI